MTTTAELQHRTLRVLVVAQVLSGAGLAAGITVGALLAQDMLGSTGLAGLPSALFTAGSALAAVGVGRISQARGRRPGLALVSGTAIITDAAPLATRARTQGLVDVSIAIAGAGGGLASGIVVDVAGYSTLSLVGGLLALAIVPAIAAGARPRTPRLASP